MGLFLHSIRREARSLFGESILGFLSGGLDLLRSVLVELHEFGQIKLGLLEHLNLTDEDVLKREDLGALLGDLLSNRVGEATKVYN